ncbi:hypothetical protein [Clostridium estertheticum]|uniref:hypothetical protein n=1 Tax=Clostridium estertheticum TaxID=238834 RepID=UPI001C6EEF01|nr:hypothetical protein [Clostridium estertheticum]MBW9151451.1 hypothetical protein [Clostridium estertheticum]WLC83410.1 hypothetical protein KTC97_15115 [Clostridium estertheticum]
MDILKTPLIAIFKEQNPYRILGNYFKFDDFKANNYITLNDNVFKDLCQQIDIQYSKDEVENLYYIVNDNMRKEVQGQHFHKSVFNLLINYSEKMLENCGNNVKCRYKDLLKWRMVVLKLDQDLFITSFLAFKDLLMHVEREYFDWDTIIKSNNIRLHNMLSKGMAENHFHLKGSAPTFKLSWVSLMNDINNRKLCELDGESNRLEKDLEGIVNIEDSIVIAALIRAILFVEINKEVADSEDDKNQKQNYESEMMKILKSLISPIGEVNKEFISVYSSDIQTEINTLKFIFGSEIKYKNNNVKVDYALTNSICAQDKATKLFQGERAFMYKCFHKIYEGNKEFSKKADLFYVYIIIKNKVRGELIQQNNRVGFANFADYQGRKTGYLKDNTILKDAVEPLAILTSIKNQNILSIEARVIPSENKQINITSIKNTDQLICNQIYNDRDNFWRKEYEDLDEVKREYSISEREIFEEEQKKDMGKLIDNYFYVFHFPKIKDPLERNTEEEFYFLNRCRHYKYRKQLKNWGTAIYKMREENQEIANRVLGIDACSNEMYTRPEVYGQVFRFLKGHLAINDYQRQFSKGKSISKLRATYHVGEDFLDVMDGLRAIDEAKIFLNLTHGDRLGHAIALGIDVEEWYRKKMYRVYLSKQEILDNIAWLITKIKNFNIQKCSDITNKLVAIYNKYYIEIYTNKLKGVFSYKVQDFTSDLETDKTVIPVDTYMEAWKLRGDNPEYYNDETVRLGISYWDRCAKRKSDTIISDNRVIVELYMRYHYDAKVKGNGYKKEVFKIEPYMIYAIKEVQKCMQVSIRECGIGIECNPSSNVLISTFKRYDKHPILNMYNLGLTIDEDKAEKSPQMFVSINTDDQGVFDTLLENEYALMGIALEKAKDKDGNSLYNQSMIYDWLDRVRQMGLEQSFRIINNSKNRY